MAQVQTPVAPGSSGVEEPRRRFPSDVPQPRPSGASTSDGRFYFDLATALVAVSGITAHLFLRFTSGFSSLTQNVPLYAVLVFGGFPLVLRLIRKSFAGEFGSDLLAGISIVASTLMAQFIVGSIVVLMLSGGTVLEEFATRRASSVLEALSKRLPQVAHRKMESGIADIKVSEIAVGDALVVFPHEICPADGVIVEGQGSMNEAYLTGEPFDTSKTQGAQVISGAINGESALAVRATRLPIDSRYARIMRVMEETQARRPRLRRLGDLLGAWYTPLAVTIALGAWLASGDSHRFLAVVVIATPCPLLLAIPVAIIGAVSLSARRGIIIKNQAALEQLGQCTTLIFDKTGTLTYGRPALIEILCADGTDRNEFLRAVANLERYSKHPLARAILDAAAKANQPLDSVVGLSESPGQGLSGTVGGHQVWITGRKQATVLGAPIPELTAGLMRGFPGRRVCGHVPIPRCVASRWTKFCAAPGAKASRQQGLACLGRSRF